MDDKQLTELVLEALAAKMKAQSFQTQIAAIDRDLAEMKAVVKKVEDAQREYAAAKATALRAADQSQQLLVILNQKIREITALTDRTKETANEAIRNVQLMNKDMDFDAVIAPIKDKIGTAEQLRGQMAKVGRDIQARKDELKRAGIDVDAAAKSPARVSL